MSYFSTVLEKLAQFFRGILFWHAWYTRTHTRTHIH